MMRYIAEHTRSGGETDMGERTLVRTYASDKNALRFMHRHLAAPEFAEGQYRVSTWPESGQALGLRHVGWLYKKAEVS